MITALDIVGRIISNRAVQNVVKAAGRAALRSAAKEIARVATTPNRRRPVYQGRKTDRA